MLRTNSRHYFKNSYLSLFKINEAKEVEKKRCQEQNKKIFRLQFQSVEGLELND